MEAREALKSPKQDSIPVDPSDQEERPFAFMADSVVDSVIGHIHPEKNPRREELVSALKLQFLSDDPESDYHYRLLMALKLVGFGINPDYEADPDNEDLLMLADEEVFREEFLRNNEDFRFIRGEHLVDYLLGFANQKITEEANTFPRDFSADFSAWYSKLQSTIRVDK